MNQCPHCGQPRKGDARKCPVCDVFYSAIDEFLAAEEEQEQRDWIKTRLKRVWASADRKQAMLQEYSAIKQSMPKGSGFVLYVVLAFVFAMIVVVL